MQSFSYVRPRTAPEAVSAFARVGAGARFIAGGTTLYDLMKLDIERPVHLIDITAIHGLDRIETDGDRLRFEALAPMSAIAANPLVVRDYPVLAEALSKAASQQLRNMATVGGNLLQRTRCMYFRNGANGVYPCNKREPGSGCAAIGGLDRGQAVLGASTSCTAVSPGDWPVALLAMDATLEILGPAGSRSLPVGNLYRLRAKLGSRGDSSASLRNRRLAHCLQTASALSGTFRTSFSSTTRAVWSRNGSEPTTAVF